MSAQVAQNQGFQEFIAEGISVVDFWGEACPPCQVIAPVIEALAEEYTERAQIAKVNVYQEPELAAQYEVMSIPTIIVFKNGQELQRLRGMTSKKVLAEIIDAAL